MPRTAADRLEFRVTTEVKCRLRRAAELSQLQLSDFVRTAAEERADQILREHAATVVPPDFFDALWSALEAPPAPSPALARAARRADDVLAR